MSKQLYMRSTGWQKSIDFGKNLTSILTLKFSHSEFFSCFSGYIYCYVIIVSFLSPPFYYKLKNAKCDHKYKVRNICPDVHLKCELHVRMKLYRVACSFSAGSNFFRNRRKSPSHIFSYKCAIAQVHLGTNVRIGKEYLAWTLREGGAL